MGWKVVGKIRREEIEHVVAAVPGEAVNVQDIYPLAPLQKEMLSLPLSFAQQRLWFLDQYEPNSSLYNIPGSLRLRGYINIGALEHSVNEIIRRHESLRTTFSMVEGEPVQVIAPSVGLSLPVVDLRDHPESEREQETRRLANEEAQRPFDLARGPLIRSQLLRLGEDEHVLLLTMHHIVSDGWSIGVLYRELSALYEAFSQSKPSPLPDLPIQYRDFAVWQREWLQGEVLDRQLSYWKKQLDGIPNVLNLPTDRPRPVVQSYRGACQSIELSKELTDGLKALSRKEGVTLFMTLLAAFQTLLYRYTGQEDIVVGSPIANRNRIEIEGLIGFFVNTLVLRSNFDGDPTFKELLSRVRKTALGAYAHQDLPFDRLVEELQPERSLSHSPLFQVMFVLQNAPGMAPKLDGLDVSAVKLGGATAKFDLTLSMSEAGEGLSGSIAYKADLFDGTTIDRLLGHFQILLEGIIGNPEQQISKLLILSAAEERQLLLEWNDTKTVYPKDKFVHQLFEEQAERSPSATAVVFEDQRLTYRELNLRANQLAHYLRKFGVGAETLVCISVERSLEMVIGVLGILKAGGAYVPLDPQYPKDRLAFMLADTHASILLTQEHVVGRLPGYNIARVICLDRDWQQIARERDDNPISKTEAENSTYVIYTSGSTGKPKGVMVCQSGLFNVIQTQIRVFRVQQNSRVLQFASLSFDASISEIMMALCAGATLCLGRREDLLPGEPLVGFLLERAITHCTLPPSAIAALPFRPLPLLSTVTVAGEICSAELVARWAPGRRFFNLYGPTEASIWTSGMECIPNGDTPPIGKPIANAKIYILDADLRAMPIGLPGELCIGGIGLARGYLNRPELTAEKFIPNPFADQPGARLYKTGDLARYLPDGNIEFLGRMDHQVKIRGFRIEVGEIEALLSQHPAVKETVALAREDSENQKSEIENPKSDRRLVAYVVPVNKQSTTTGELRTFLKQKLPEYMIPSAFVFLDALPLTSNRKIDRRALPAPDHSRPELKDMIMAPRTPTEEMLAGIWAKLLRVNGVGIRDSFFDLGGHSLLAVRLFAEIEKTFKKRPPLSRLFQEPTVEHLAAWISQENPTKAPASPVAIQPEGSKQPFFCVHEFFGDVFCYLNLARYLGQNQPIYALQPRGLDGEVEPFDDVEAMAAYYIDTIRTVQPHGPYALGGLCFGGVIAFEMAQQLCSQGEPVSLVALLDSGINSGYDNTSRLWPRFETVFRGIPSWLTGALELNGSQWLDLIKLKRTIFRSNFGARNGNPQRSKLIDEMADLFGFSDKHRKVARAQQQAMRNYRPGIYPGRLTLFRARMQPLFSSHRPDKGWRRVAGGGLDIRVVPGNHLGMLQEPHVKILAQQLTACLEKANIKSGSEPRSTSQPTSRVFSEQ